MNEIWILLGILALLMAYQLWITVRIFRAEEYERYQKWLQFALIWIVPLLGAIAVHVVLWANRAPPSKKDKHFTPQEFGEGG